MNSDMTQSLAWDHIRESRTALGRLGQRIAMIIAECNYAQRRSTVLRMAPDTYRDGRDKAPADYTEFLFRTSGALLREPTAARRAKGRLVG